MRRDHHGPQVSLRQAFASRSAGSRSFCSEAEATMPPLIFNPTKIFHIAAVVSKLLLVLGATAAMAFGTESGTTAFPNGGEDFLVAAMPPPGWYGIVYFNHYGAHRLVDDTGHMPLQSFDLAVDALTLRTDWVKPAAVLGADRWGTLVVLPLLDISLDLAPIPGVSLHSSRRGPADLTIGNGLHWTLKHFEMVNALDVVVPTGSFDQSSLVNPGRNQWVVRLNHMGTWTPQPSWEISYRLHWDDNFENADTHYHSGQTVYLNWAVGWKPTPTTTVGLAGFFLRQVTDDRQSGNIVVPAGNRLRVDGIGPVVKYIGPHGVMLTAKYFRDFAVRNHPQGEQFWFYVAFPF